MINRLKVNGYKTIHLFKDFYLVRRYSTRYKKFSSYDFRRIPSKGGGTDG